MRCKRCGSEIRHVPEHLSDLAEWLCQQCTNTAPKRNVVETMVRKEEESEREKEKAA